MLHEGSPMAVLPQDQRGLSRATTIVASFPRTDVDSRLVVGTITVLAMGLASFLAVTVGVGLILGTAVVQDAVFSVALIATWTAVGLGLVATRWLYSPDRMGRVARLAAFGAVALLMLTGVGLWRENAQVPATCALVFAATLAWLTLRPGDDSLR